MRPTDILSAEHRVIEQVLDCLEALAHRARAESLIDQARATQILEVLRTFADRCHHGKEEERLFPMLVARGMPTHVGPIAVMLDDHRAGRECIRAMTEACAAADVPGFVAAAESYVGLLREHIQKEDGVLFPMAESMLDEAAREALLGSFTKMESDEMGAGTHERMLAMADEIAHHYGVPLAAQRTSCGRTQMRCGHSFG